MMKNLLGLFRRWRERRELERAWLENELWNRENDYAKAYASAAAAAWMARHLDN